MPLPQMPWYEKLEKTVAPTERATNVLLVILLALTLAILLWGSPLLKAGWVVYLISP